MPFPCRLGAVCSFVTMWVSGSVCVAAESDTGSSVITQESIAISLPVFISSVIATAIFVWTVSKYDARRERRMMSMERKLLEIMRRYGIDPDGSDSETTIRHDSPRRPRRQ